MASDAILALENGLVFRGVSIGYNDSVCGEVVFNTSMTGYQEILTDPSYASQIVTLTYPHIGNVGINEQDSESAKPWVSGLVVRDSSPIASNWRHQETLSQYLVRNKIVAISDIDTRHLTNVLREEGALSGCLVAGDSIDEDEAVEKAKAFPGLKGLDLAKVVTTSKPYKWNEGVWPEYKSLDQEEQKYHIVAFDYGVKRNILRMLSERGCQLTVVPAKTSFDEVMALKPDGIFLSNGPGDPEPCDYAIATIKSLLEVNVPIFGICLGCQLLALASGASTIKMKFGHHGANHPVECLETKRVFITSQNHGFAVDENSLPDNVIATHRSLFDGSLQGIKRTDVPAFAFQGHPEASPGPHDLDEIFDDFIAIVKANMATPKQASAAKLAAN